MHGVVFFASSLLVVVSVMVVLWLRKTLHDDEPEPGNRPIVCVDFDGVLHSMRSGWCGITEVVDEPVKGAIPWLERLVEDGGLEVCVFGYRSRSIAGREAMRSWLLVNGMPKDTLQMVYFPKHKPAATLSVDDCSYRFEGDYFPGPRWCANFKPWWMRKTGQWCGAEVN